MKTVVFYEPNGRITSTGQLPENCLPETGWLEVGEFRTDYDVTFRVVDGALAQLPPKPSAHCVFDYAAGTWTRDLATAWGVVRYQRDQKLVATDWTTLADVPLAPEVRAAWMAYRQALRDVTDQADPDAVVWPAPPA